MIRTLRRFALVCAVTPSKSSSKTRSATAAVCFARSRSRSRRAGVSSAGVGITYPEGWTSTPSSLYISLGIFDLRRRVDATISSESSPSERCSMREGSFALSSSEMGFPEARFSLRRT